MEISWPMCVTSWRVFSAQLSASLPGPTLAGEQDPTMPGASTPPGDCVQGSPALRRDKGQHNPETIPEHLNHPTGPNLAEMKGLCWGKFYPYSPSTGGSPKGCQGEGCTFGSLQIHKESSHY